MYDKFPLQIVMILIYNDQMNSNHHTIANNYAPVRSSPSKPVLCEGSSVAGVVRTSSQAIFSGAEEVEIDHNGALYRLRQTSSGKLILTK